MAGALGRKAPEDWAHVEKHPFSAIASVPASLTVEKVRKLPKWHWTHNQGNEGSCVGHGVSMERAITNTAQNSLARLIRPGRRYDPIWLWNEAKKTDEWPDTNPGDDNGTSVRAAYDVLRTEGTRRVKSMVLEGGIPTPVDPRPVDINEGIFSNRWTQSVDEMRLAVSQGIPVAIGVNWYEDFDTPVLVDSKQYFIGVNSTKLGSVRGGHCVCIYGASDKRQAFRVKNSWGHDYPLVWLPYKTMARLLSEDGEASLVTDR